MQSPYRRAEKNGAESEHETHTQLAEIQKELEALKQRRLALEVQRKRLLSCCNSNLSGSHSNIPPMRSSSQGPTEISGRATSRSHSQLARTHSSFQRRQPDASVMSASEFIPSESQRRKQMHRNVYTEMKESMRRSWERDSTLLMGTFLLEDNPHSSTFGRERRFIPIVGQKGQYYLSSDTELMSKTKNNPSAHLTASDRGKRGTNISSHWNDIQCGGPPGPGTYTPRYGKLSKPSLLTRL